MTKNTYTYSGWIFGMALLAISNFTIAQVNPGPPSDQKAWLKSDNPKLERNKKIVYDFWREVLEAGHMDLAPQFMTETYIQHNPNVPTGRQGFIDFFSKILKPQPIVDSIKGFSGPLITIVAEGNLVILVFKRELPDPKDPSKKYTTTDFEMLRVEEGKVAEHWDTALKQ
jgi:predicted SnoaL-like aldol condensation-catalyzing enzyme